MRSTGLHCFDFSRLGNIVKWENQGGGARTRAYQQCNLVPRVSLLFQRPREAEKRDPGNEVANSGSSHVIRMRTSRTGHFSLASTVSAKRVENKVPRNKGKRKLCVHAKQSRNCHNTCVFVNLSYIIKFLT